ncbi:hypothetical protein AADZ90_022265 [Aestuariibius sp. 2305UL40-4]|uniref:hypothetical protein n=1 Tax=Aestuariibius violaceus TaxID=3234132 RepID=UPI00345E668F
MLAKLGESGLSESLSDLAAAARIGALPVDEDLEADLRAACAEIAALRVVLMQGLGVDAARAAYPDLFGPEDAP